MKMNQRFIKSICQTAAKEEITLPWARGSRRAAFIAKRKAAQPTPLHVAAKAA